jgi:hypothetical protein
MPAWIAGIQIRKDASGNIRVNGIPALQAEMTMKDVRHTACFDEMCSIVQIINSLMRGINVLSQKFRQFGFFIA